MSRIVNLYDLSVDMEDLLFIRVHHGHETHRLIFQYRQHFEYVYHPGNDAWLRHPNLNIVVRTFTDYDEARDAYEAFILEWTRYKNDKGRYFSLFHNLGNE